MKNKETKIFLKVVESSDSKDVRTDINIVRGVVLREDYIRLCQINSLTRFKLKLWRTLVMV